MCTTGNLSNWSSEVQIPWNQFVLVLGVNCMQLNNDFLDLESTTLSLI